MVDVIHGQRQVVIKSLETNYRHVPGVAAATILGDGRGALTLDVAAIVVELGHSEGVAGVATEAFEKVGVTTYRRRSILP